MTNHTEVKNLIDQNYNSSELIQSFDELVVKLNSGKWVNKDEMLQILLGYQTKNQSFINQLAQIVVLSQINYSVVIKQNEDYKEYYESVTTYAKDINEAFDLHSKENVSLKELLKIIYKK